MSFAVGSISPTMPPPIKQSPTYTKALPDPIWPEPEKKAVKVRGVGVTSKGAKRGRRKRI